MGEVCKIFDLFPAASELPRHMKSVPAPSAEEMADEDINIEIGELADRLGLSTFATAAMVLREVYGQSDAEIAEDLDVPEDVANALAIAGIRQYKDAVKDK